jgi:hypothetical protein
MLLVFGDNSLPLAHRFTFPTYPPKIEREGELLPPPRPPQPADVFREI